MIGNNSYSSGDDQHNALLTRKRLTMDACSFLILIGPFIVFPFWHSFSIGQQEVQNFLESGGRPTHLRPNIHYQLLHFFQNVTVSVSLFSDTTIDSSDSILDRVFHSD